MSRNFLLYGATGYTGKLIVGAAVERGLRPILAGRNRGRLSALAEPLGLEWRACALDDPHGLDEALADVDAVLHAAGPFAATPRPMLDACLRTGTNYLDIAGELDVLEACAARDREARAAGITVLPAVGFDVVPSDCLAAHMKARLPSATRLTLAIAPRTGLSRGTAKTTIEQIAARTMVRRAGAIVELGEPVTERIDFGDGPVPVVAISWGDVSTAYHSTGIPNITVLFEAIRPIRLMARMGPLPRRLLSTPPAQALLKWLVDRSPEGPSQSKRESGSAILVAVAEDDDGNVVRSRLETAEPYKLTALTSVAIVHKVADGKMKPGFQTASTACGADFILDFPGSKRVDLP